MEDYYYLEKLGSIKMIDQFKFLNPQALISILGKY